MSKVPHFEEIIQKLRVWSGLLTAHFRAGEAHGVNSLMDFRAFLAQRKLAVVYQGIGGPGVSKVQTRSRN